MKVAVWIIAAALVVIAGALVLPPAQAGLTSRPTLTLEQAGEVYGFTPIGSVK